MKQQPLHVVVGANGGIGAALIRELRRRDIPSRAVVRTPRTFGDEVEVSVADATDHSALAQAFRGAGVVYHAAQPPYPRWVSTFPPLTDAIADVASAAGAKLVLADNLYMYGPLDGPISERTPTEPTSAKGHLRRDMAERLLDRHRRGELRVTLGRSSDYYGPGGLGSAIGEQLFGAVVQGKKPRWLGDPDVPHTEHYLGDIARGLVELGVRDEADGRAWHLPAAPAMTGREFVALVSRVAGRDDVSFVRTTRGMVRLAGLVSPMIRAVGDVMGQWEQPFVIDASDFQRAFGRFESTPHEEAVATTVAWFRDRERTTG
jgi:nucleoside-diphosphate-sugar epimerase